MQAYQETVAELAEAAKGIRPQPPTLELETDLVGFCQTLRRTAREQRPAEVRKFIRPLVDSRLQPWRLTLEHAPSLLIKLHNTAEQIEADKSRAESVAGEADARLRDLTFKVDRLREREDKARREEEVLKPPSSFTVMSYRMLIFGSLLVGIVTAWYYLGMQAQMLAARMNVPFVSTLEFLREHPEDTIYIFGVVVFLLAGKIASVVHARLGHPGWLFVLVGVAALATTGGTVVLIAQVSSAQQEVILLDRAIVQAAPSPFSGIDCSSPGDQQEEACRRLAGLQGRQAALTNQMAGQGFWMTILVLAAEILLGSVAWMLASEHHEKHGTARQLLDQKKNSIRDQIQAIEQQIKETREARERTHSDRLLADRLIHRLDELKALIPGRDFIERTSQAVMDQELARGGKILNDHEERWAVEDARPRAAE